MGDGTMSTVEESCMFVLKKIIINDQIMSPILPSVMGFTRHVQN